jgi:hypothetical protein
MKQYDVGRYVFLSIIGFVIFGSGLALIKMLPEAGGILKTLPYLCVGIGAGIFGGNLGTAIRNKKMLNNPQAAKQMEIEQKDERNQAISNRAKARAYDLMIYVYAVILVAFTLMQVDMYVILTLVTVYLFFVFTNVYYFTKYNKEM